MLCHHRARWVMAGKIFINYRRDDSPGTAGRLHDRLAQTFGRNNLFMDVDHIPAGVDFTEYLHNQVAACDVFLAVIGPDWLDAKDDSGHRRFDNPDDFVTIEIAAALARNIRVIPVLVDGARTPKADKLPDSIRPLVRRNAVELRNTHFGRDAEALTNKVREALQDKRPFIVMVPGRWRTVAGSATALLLVGWIGLYQAGVPVWVPWAPDPLRAAADAEAKRKAAEAERQRLAAIKVEEQRQARASDVAPKAAVQQQLNEEIQRQTKATADAEANAKAAEAEQQRQTKAAADADKNRKAAEPEQQRLKDEVQRQTKAAAEADAKRKAAEARAAAVPEAVTTLAKAPFEIRTNTVANVKSTAITSYSSSSPSIGDCEASCARLPACKMFSYRKDFQFCYLFSSAT